MGIAVRSTAQKGHGSVPQAFIRFHNDSVARSRPKPVVAIADVFANGARRYQSFQNSGAVMSLTDLLLRVGFLALLALALASLIRSARERTLHPFLVTISAVLSGIATVPVVAIALRIGTFVARKIPIVMAGAIGVVRRLSGYVKTFFVWAAPVLTVVLIAALAVIALYILYLGIQFLIEGHLVLAAIGGAVVLAIAVFAMRAGWLDPVGRIVFGVSKAISSWLSRYFAPVAAWVFRIVGYVILAIMALAIFLAGAISVLSALGAVGRLVVLPIVQAPTAGHSPLRCANTVAGAGLSASVVLSAAATDAAFGWRFALLWNSTPVLNRLPNPVQPFEWLFSNIDAHWLENGLQNYSPLLDVAVLVVPTILGTLSLMFARKRWETSSVESKVWDPILLTICAGLALLLPVILLSSWAQPDDQ
jgi:hypothetical protein